MTIFEILNEYRSNDLDLKYKYGSLDEDIKNKITIIKQIYADNSSFRYSNDSIRIVFLYYLERMTAEQIAEVLDISPRTVYRKRDEGIRRLSHFFGE